MSLTARPATRIHGFSLLVYAGASHHVCAGGADSINQWHHCIKQSTQCKAKYYQLRANLYQSLEHANQLMPMLQHDYHTKKIQLVRYLAFFVINQKV